MLFTERLTINNPVKFESNKERIININTISLESTDNSKELIDIYCENKRKKESFKICSLKKNSNEIYSTNLYLDIHNFKDKYEIYLKTKSKNVVVNIIGYYEEEEDEEEPNQAKISTKNQKKEEKKKKKEKNEKEQKNIKNKEKTKDKDKEKEKIKNNDNNKKDIELQEEEDNEDKNKDKKKIKKNKEKHSDNDEDENSESKSNSNSNSDSDENDNEVLEDNGPSVSIVDLFQKSRKEKPQELKPVTLKNLASPTNDNKNKKKKLDNKTDNNNENKNENKKNINNK